MRSKRATISDVARLSGVSTKTVSRVLNDEPNVRPATRAKVIEAAENLQYKPNPSARSLASRYTFVVGLLYDNPNSDYVMAIQHGALAACRQSGYNLLINPMRTDSPGLIREIVELSRQVDGFIVLQPLSDVAELNQLLEENEFPCVRVSQRPFGALPRISVGDAAASEAMTEHLLSLGHRRIGFVVGHPDHGQSHDRLEGYRRALARRGVEFDESLVEQGRFDFDSGLAATRRLLTVDRPPTAIFASNDPMALGALRAARELGFDVPDDVSIAGFDDAPMAGYTHPPLTTVRQPITELSTLATEVLLSQVRDRAADGTHHCLRAELVPRASTAPPSRRSGRPAGAASR